MYNEESYEHELETEKRIKELEEQVATLKRLLKGYRCVEEEDDNAKWDPSKEDWWKDDKRRQEEYDEGQDEHEDPRSGYAG